MVTASDIANTLVEAKAIMVELKNILDTKKAWTNDDEKKDFHARINHVELKSEKPGKKTTLKVDLNEIDDLAVKGIAPATPVPTTPPTTPTTITKKIEPKPIVWLGRGYMGDAND